MKKNLSFICAICLLVHPFLVDASLSFGNATSDRVIVTANSSINTLGNTTVLAWVNPTDVNFRMFAGKTDGTNGWFFRIQSNGNLQFNKTRAANTNYITNNTPLGGSIGTWKFVAVTYDSGAAAGEIVNMYVGSSTALAVEATYGTATDGSGAATSDSGTDFLWGNRIPALPGDAFKGSIAWGMVINRALTLQEIRTLQFHPRYVSGCVMYHQLGFNGTGTQLNLCGSGNSGTVSGPTVSGHAPLRSPFGF